jgi:hypothetical protein
MYIKGLSIVLTIALASNAFAQNLKPNFEQFYQFKVGKGPGEIEFSKRIQGSSPAFFSFFDGKRLWIGETRNGTVFDIMKKEIVDIYAYPNDPNVNFANGGYRVITDKYFYMECAGIGRWNIDRAGKKFDNLLLFPDVKCFFPLYLFKDYVFFYDEGARAFDPKGNLISEDETVELLLSWLKTTWYHDPERRELHRKLISSGSLIVDGIFYPSNAGSLYKYLALLEIPLDSFVLLKNSPDIPRGISMNGEIFVDLSKKIIVINQDGQVVATIDNTVVQPMITDPRYVPTGPEYYNITGTLYTVHPNGDIYSIYAIKDQVSRIHKAEKTWGPDLIGMARAGVANGGEGALREKLLAYSPVELRILRNAIMAIHNYAFKGKDLTDYFLGYDWYEPDPSVKNDTAILTPDQKRLFDLVLGIEKERVVP